MGANDGGKRNDFKQVAGRKATRALVGCSKPGCTGTCPLSVVARSNQKDGVPAKCFECGRKYKVPAGGAGPPQKQPGKKQALQDNPEVKQELMAVRKELAALKASVATSAKPDEGSLGEQGAEPELQAELKAARTEISALRELDETLHGLIQGGYEAALAAAEAKRDTILARQRGGLPLKAQLSKAQAFVEFTSRC